MPTSAAVTIAPKWRWLISIAVVLHLVAVFVPPLSVQTRGPLGQSPLVASLSAPVEGYGQFLHIDRGYAFFAPDPGPSHLFQAAITSKDGKVREQMYPDLDDQWPRLLYHRHFMLSEYLEQIYQPPGPPPQLQEIDAGEAEAWRQSRLRYEEVRKSVVDHLKKKNPGQEVAIRRVEHLIPSLSEYVDEPISLDDQRLYRVLLDQPVDLGPPVTAETLTAPSRPAEAIPTPAGEVAP